MRKLIPGLLILALVTCQNDQSPRAENHAGIVRTANLSMIVDDTYGTIAKITSAAESAGGHVIGYGVWRDGDLLQRLDHAPHSC